MTVYIDAEAEGINLETLTGGEIIYHATMYTSSALTNRAAFTYGPLSLSVQASYHHYARVQGNAPAVDRFFSQNGPLPLPLECYETVEAAILEGGEITGKARLAELGLSDAFLARCDGDSRSVVFPYVTASEVGQLHSEVRHMARELEQMMAQEGE